MPSLTDPWLPSGSLNKSEQPVLQVDELRLRPWVESDAEALRAAFDDPAIQQWHARTVDSRAEAARMIVGYNQDWSDETAANWAVVDPGVPGILGRAAVKRISFGEGTAHIAYWVTAAARGRSIAPRATVAMTTWAFEELGLHRLILSHSTANSASCRVAEKAGYAAEGISRSSALHGDGWHDMHIHARIASGA